MLRPNSSLFNAAGDAGAGATGGAAGAASASANPQPATQDPAVKELQAEWKGKDYAEIAAHHVQLTGDGRLDEAAFFHKNVVMTFKAKK